MKKLYLGLIASVLSSKTFAAGTLPFVQSVTVVSENFQAAMFAITILAGIIWILYSYFGEGQMIQKFLNWAILGALGLNVITVVPILFGAGAAGALIP